METKFKTEFVKDLPGKIVTVKREFDAAPDLLWRAWTESSKLDLLKLSKTWKKC